MARIESSIHVSNTIEDIFAFLSKRESHRKFIPRMTELRQTSHGVFEQPGTKLSGMLNYFGIRIPVQYEIMEVQQNRSLAMRGQMGPVQFKDGYILGVNQKGSEIKFWLELIPQGWVQFFSPFMGMIGKIHAWETLRNLERELIKEEIASRRSQ